MAMLVAIRLFVVQVIEHTFYEALASGQHELEQQLLPERGEIFAQDRFAKDGLAVLATNRAVSHVYLNPKQVTDSEKVAEVVAPILGMDPEVVQERASKEGDLYEPLQSGVTEQQLNALTAAIEENSLTGVHTSPEEGRYYPEGLASGGVTGFVGTVDDKRVGQYGLEGFYDQELAGTPGHLNTSLDASGRFIAAADKDIVDAQDGDMLVLTIDKNIQYKACTLLQQAVEKFNGKQGTIIVMNPSTGAIMALCNAPLYDPNVYSEVEDIEVFINDAVSDQYEPGSVFKPVTMAAAINEGHVTPYTTYEDTGAVEIGQFTIRNSDEKANGVVDMTTVLEFSLNTGAIYAVQKVGNEKWYEYLQQFGFGERTGITLSAENPGNISSVGLYKDVYSATSSYGQGITVTPLQMLQSYAAFANDGVIMKPYIVERVVKANGFQEQTEPVELSRPITAETARTVGAMLVRVIDGGHAIKAAVDGYFMAGKTGTAQVPKENGVGYDAHRHKDTFVGYGPVSDPQFVAIVKIDEPTEVPWAASSAAPVFSELAQYILNYLQVPPDRVE